MKYTIAILALLIIPIITTDSVAQDAKQIISEYCQYKKNIDPNFECPTLPHPQKSTAGARHYLAENRPTIGDPVTRSDQNGESAFDFSNFDSSNLVWVVAVVVAILVIIGVIKAYVNRHPTMPAYVEEGLRTNFSGWDDYKFEILVGDVYKKLGYRTEVTARGPDQGVDVIAKGKGKRIIIQAKRWNSNVGSREVRETVGAMPMYRATKAVVITTHDFSRSAYEVCQRTPNLELINMEKFHKLILKAYRKSQNDTKGQTGSEELIRCRNCGQEYHISYGNTCPNCSKKQEKQKEENEGGQKSDFSLKECYQILNVSENATADEINRAHRKLTNIWHPDKHEGLNSYTESKEKMKKINIAYQKLLESGKVN